MRKITGTAVILLLSLSSLAQHQLTGIVRDVRTGSRLEGATVQIRVPDRLEVTDAMGTFHFDNLAAGDVELLVRHVGFKEQSLMIRVPSEETLTVSLEESSTITDEVIVEATRATEKTPTTFTNISKREIAKQNFGQDLPYLLNWTPSLVTTSDAGNGVGYTGVRIRGSDATRINVTINGIPYNDSESLGTFWVDIPDIASSTQSIQIQRGVGTSTNGAGAFGGTINVQTLSTESEPHAEVTTSFGSFSTLRYTVKAGTGLIQDHWSFNGRFSGITSDGYVDRASADLTSYYVSGGYYDKRFIAKAIVFGGHEVTYQSWYGLDKATLEEDRTFNYAGALYDDEGNVTGYYDNQVDNYRQDHAQLHFSYAVSANTHLNTAFHYTYGRGFYEEYFQDMPFEALGLPDITLGDTVITSSDVITRKWLDNHFYGVTYSLTHTKDKIDLTIGGGFHRYAPALHYGELIWADYSPNADYEHRFYDGESEKNDFSIFGKMNYLLGERVQAFADLQYRRVTYQTQGIEDTQEPYSVSDQFDFLNPKAGIRYEIAPENQLYLSYAIAHREPTRSDYLDGDERPKAEQMGNLEVGWRKKTNSRQFELNYYLMQYKNQLVLTGELNNVGAPIRANVGQSYRTGIEAAAGFLITRSVQWNVNATWSRNINRSFVWIDENDETRVADTKIILSPEWIGGSQLSWEAFPDLRVAWLAKFVGQQYLDNTENEDLTLDAYFVNDLRITYEFNPGIFKRINAGILVNNLLDVAYSSNGYTYAGYPYFYPQAGRNYMAMITLSF